jgi:hypothetical protein
MKRLLLAGTAFLGLAASGSVAHANRSTSPTPEASSTSRYRRPALTRSSPLVLRAPPEPVFNLQAKAVSVPRSAATSA